MRERENEIRERVRRLEGQESDYIMKREERSEEKEKDREREQMRLAKGRED